MIKDRWMKLCKDNNISDASEKWKTIESAYSEDGRFYHTLDHISAMLDSFSRNVEVFHFPAEVEMAIFLHDIVYNTHSSSNEVDSAILAEKWTENSFLNSAMVRSLIVATQHSGFMEGRDVRYFLDLDIQIFGKSSRDYNFYSQSIRKEYSWVPEPVYCKERIKVLNNFLNGDHIFHSNIFGDEAESRARANIKNEIMALSL